MTGESGRSIRSWHRRCVPVVVLAVLLVVAACAVTLLAVGRIGELAVFGDPPRPGWTLAPGPLSGADARNGGSTEYPHPKEEA